MVAGWQEKAWYGWALFVMTLLFVATVLVVGERMRAVDAPATARAGDRFDGARALETLRAVLPEGQAHPVDSHASAVMRERILAQLQGMGYVATVQDVTSCRKVGVQTCERVRNIVLDIPGSDAPSRTKSILFAAHYDSVAAGPGASDDGAGVAILLELARWLKQRGPHRNGVVLLFSEGEEDGLLGAEAFARQHGTVGRIGAVVNVEARGTSGPSVMFETGAHSGWLVDAFANSARQPLTNSLLNDVYRMMANDTDMTVFKTRGLAGLNFAFGESPAYYHTPLDSMEELDPRSLQQQGDNVQGLLRELMDSRHVDHSHDGGEVYTDVLGAGVIRWPAAWSVGVAAASFLVFACAMVLAWRRDRIVLRGVMGGLLLLPLSMVFAAGCAWLLQFLLVTVHGHHRPWHTATLANRCLLWCMVALGTVGISRMWWRRADAMSLWAGLGVSWGLLGVALAILVPGASYLIVLPGIVLALTAWLGVLTLPSAAHQGWAWMVCVVAAAVFVIVLPSVLLVELMLGYNALLGPLATAVLLALMLVWFVPLALPSPANWTRRIGIAAATVAVAAAFVSFRAPAFDAAHPRVINVVYVQGATGDAAIIAGSSSYALPADVRSAMGPDLASRKVLPWTNASFHAMPVRGEQLPRPNFELLSTTTGASSQVWNVRLTTGANTRGFMLLVPPSAGMTAVETDGVTLEYGSSTSMLGRYQAFVCRGASCADKPVRLHLSNAGTEPWLLVSMASGLPASALPVKRARDRVAVPQNSGDQTIAIRQFRPVPPVVPEDEAGNPGDISTSP